MNLDHSSDRIVIVTHEAPDSSWWTGVSREDFSAKVAEQEKRWLGHLGGTKAKPDSAYEDRRHRVTAPKPPRVKKAPETACRECHRALTASMQAKGLVRCLTCRKAIQRRQEAA